MQDLTVTLIQADLQWEDVDANLALFDQLINGVAPSGDLIILPEMFTTGFSMAPEQLAQEMNGKAVNWLKDMAAIKTAVVTGSMMIKEDGHYFNRLLWAQPDGQLFTYDKKHLFRYANEQRVYTAGKDLAIFGINGWRIRPFICYDLRFPIWCRNLNQAYDLALFVANWPAKRAFHWQQLLSARAIENQAYVIGVNRVGTDGNGHRYDGHSAALSPAGEVLLETGNQSITHTLTLSRQKLETYRKDFPAWMDADEEMIKH